MKVEVKEKKLVSTGMKVEKEHFFECSACKAPLANLIVGHKIDGMEWNVVVECCHCGEKSYEQTIEGSFIVGRSEESDKYTAIVDYDISGDPMIIKTVKVADYV